MTDHARPRVYRIRVDGHVGERFRETFAGMRVEERGGDSILVGAVRDQSELHGMLELLSGLGLEIVGVERTGERP